MEWQVKRNMNLREGLLLLIIIISIIELQGYGFHFYQNIFDITMCKLTVSAC